MQKKRGQHLDDKPIEEEIEHYCQLTQDAETILESAVTHFGLLHRSLCSHRSKSRSRLRTL